MEEGAETIRFINFTCKDTIFSKLTDKDIQLPYNMRWTTPRRFMTFAIYIYGQRDLLETLISLLEQAPPVQRVTLHGRIRCLQAVCEFASIALDKNFQSFFSFHTRYFFTGRNKTGSGFLLHKYGTQNQPVDRICFNYRHESLLHNSTTHSEWWQSYKKTGSFQANADICLSAVAWSKNIC